MADDTTAGTDATESTPSTPPAGYIAETDVKEKYVPKEFMQSEIARRLKGKADPDALLQDEAFRARALESWGVKPEKSKPSGEDVEKLYGQWEAKHVAPLKATVETYRAEVASLRQRDLYSQLVSAAAPLVNEQLLQSPVAGQAPPIVHLLAPYFGYDEEHGGWFVKEGDGFAFAATPTQGARYKTPAEFLGEWAANKANAAWIKDQRQRGAAFQQAASKGGPVKPLAQMTTAEKVAFIGEHGQEAFDKMVYGG